MKTLPILILLALAGSGFAQRGPMGGAPGMGGPPVMGGPPGMGAPPVMGGQPGMGMPGMPMPGTFGPPPGQQQPPQQQPPPQQPYSYQPPPQQYQPPPQQYQPAYPPTQPAYQPTYRTPDTPRDTYEEREAQRRASERRAQEAREAERRRQELYVEPVRPDPPPVPRYDPPPQRYDPPPPPVQVAPGEAPRAAPPREQAPVAPSSPEGGLPSWLLPALLLLATPIILSTLKDEPQKLSAGRRLESDADDLLAAGEKMRAGEFEAAVPLLQGVVRGGGAGAPRARLLLVQCFLKSGLAEVALEEVRALDVADQPLELIYEVARAFGEAGQESAAKPLYLAILRRDVGYKDVAARVKGQTGAAPVASGAVKLPLPSSAPTPVLSQAALEDQPTGTDSVLPARFADVKFLARGGMGVVYEARDTDLERRVAIKMLSPAYCSDQAFVERFFRESRAIARLTHPNIVAVYDVARAPVPYMVMEFLDGKTLRKVLGEKSLTYRQRIEVALSVTRGLAYAHGQSVIHRDVKPENVIVNEDGRTKLVDFGLARMADPELQSGPKLTQPNVVMGTPSYMAPELYMGVPANQATDAFALGRVLRELITAEGPDSEPAHASPAVTELVDRLASVDFMVRPKRVDEAIPVLERELANMTLAPEV